MDLSKTKHNPLEFSIFPFDHPGPVKTVVEFAHYVLIDSIRANFEKLLKTEAKLYSERSITLRGIVSRETIQEALSKMIPCECPPCRDFHGSTCLCVGCQGVPIGLRF